MFIIINSTGEALTHAGFGKLQSAKMFPPVLVAETLREYPNCYAVAVRVQPLKRSPR